MFHSQGRASKDFHPLVVKVANGGRFSIPGAASRWKRARARRRRELALLFYDLLHLHPPHARACHLGIVTCHCLALAFGPLSCRRGLLRLSAVRLANAAKQSARRITELTPFIAPRPTMAFVGPGSPMKVPVLWSSMPLMNCFLVRTWPWETCYRWMRFNKT